MFANLFYLVSLFHIYKQRFAITMILSKQITILGILKKKPSSRSQNKTLQ
jgi:hypothetical protein